MVRRGAWCAAAAWALVLCGAARAGTRPKDWTDAHYAKFTPAKFAGYRPANQEINFKQVDDELLSAAMFFETNLRRIKHHRKPFRYSPALRRAAFGHAKDMVERDFHGHVNPDDPTRRTLAQRLARVGVRGGARSENVAYTPARRYPGIPGKPGEFRIDPSRPPRPHTYRSFARQVVDRWMASPGHRRNILSKATPYLGCGAFYCQKEALTSQGEVLKLDYFKSCQDFASRRGPAAKD